MRWPNLQEIAIVVKAEQADLAPDDEWEIRLHVFPDGQWSLFVGDAGGDLDEPGCYGVGVLTGDSNADALARVLLAEAQAAVSQTTED